MDVKNMQYRCKMKQTYSLFMSVFISLAFAIGISSANAATMNIGAVTNSKALSQSITASDNYILVGKKRYRTFKSRRGYKRRFRGYRGYKPRYKGYRRYKRSYKRKHYRPRKYYRSKRYRKYRRRYYTPFYYYPYYDGYYGYSTYGYCKKWRRICARRHGWRTHKWRRCVRHHGCNY